MLQKPASLEIGDQPHPKSRGIDSRLRRAGDRLRFERPLWSQGVLRVAGVDEAGRGPLAGPVVAAAVILPASWGRTGVPKDFADLNDSKQLTEDEREVFFARIMEVTEITFAIARVDASEIDRINILRATHLAMNHALAQLPARPEHVLVDGLRVDSMPFPHTPLVQGDARSYSIAAASVLAKVTRDRWMTEYDHQYPEYGFAAHKGYGTDRHFQSLRTHGPCPIHRRTFSPLKHDQLEFCHLLVSAPPASTLENPLGPTPMP